MNEYEKIFGEILENVTPSKQGEEGKEINDDFFGKDEPIDANYTIIIDDEKKIKHELIKTSGNPEVHFNGPEANI